MNRCPHCGAEIDTDGLALAPLSANPLTAQLLDLITLMPDHQTQEILDYITSLREIRARHAMADLKTRYPVPPR